MGRFRWLALATIVALSFATLAYSSAATASPTNGRIAFMRWDVAAQDQFAYTANPDGTAEALLVPYPAERPRWSPDGRELLFESGDFSARIMTMDTGAVRALPRPSRMFLGCATWSADGTRLLCEGGGDSPDENTTPELNGIYTIRASDGGDLRRVTTNVGGEDIPQDVSPDGSELVFVSDRDNDALFVIGLDGSGLRRLAAGGLLDVSSASWSPDGEWIVFSARKAAGERRSLFLIRPSGDDLHEIRVNPACGGADRDSRGCLDPTWSPDGSKILFAILLGYNLQKQLYTIDTNGSHLMKVTRHGFVRGDNGEGEQAPDWGIHPLQ